MSELNRLIDCVSNIQRAKEKIDREYDQASLEYFNFPRTDERVRRFQESHSEVKRIQNELKEAEREVDSYHLKHQITVAI